MKIDKFISDYNLHDSYIESIETDDHNQTVTLNINLAFWMQKDYVESMPENGIVKAVFHNVSLYSCEDGDPTGEFVSILNAEYRDGTVVISLLDDESVSCFEMIISADEVTVSIE